jgi:hypothetical protein
MFCCPKHILIDKLWLAQKLRQFRDIYGNPSRLVFGEQLSRRSPTGLFLEIDIGQLLPGAMLRIRGITTRADMKSRFRAGAKVCSGAIVVLLVIAALGPAKWAPRTELGWRFDHFIGYFGITLFFCFGWPRPFMVGGVVMAVAALLEALQALRHRIDRLILRPHSGARPGRWPQLSFVKS